VRNVQERHAPSTSPRSLIPVDPDNHTLQPNDLNEHLDNAIYTEMLHGLQINQAGIHIHPDGGFRVSPKAIRPLWQAAMALEAYAQTSNPPPTTPPIRFETAYRQRSLKEKTIDTRPFNISDEVFWDWQKEVEKERKWWEKKERNERLKALLSIWR